jgi:16S rRNA C967 or C1407 C5-methylase (RsmB/RsmF family)/NOL1/NOP2/fmu family ribosome biogenesis protein
MSSADSFHPEFVRLLSETSGADTPVILESLLLPHKTSVRFNSRKLDVTDGKQFFPGSVAVPWCKEGIILESRPVFTLDPLFYAGAYYVQEPSSMAVGILEDLLKKRAGEMNRSYRMLDLAASPGGKSTHLSSIMPEGAVLIANEVIKSRVAALVENTVKWGEPGVMVTSADPSQFGRSVSFFDFIMADVPCSGEGMYRKNREQVIDNWSPENVRNCASRQRRIIADIWPALVPGGIMAYSTCTFNKYENDLNIAWIRDELGADIIDPGSLPDYTILSGAGVKISPEGGLQFFPGVTSGEGLFFALLEKRGGVGVKTKIKQSLPDNIQIVYSPENIKPVAGKQSLQPEYAYALSLDYAGEYPSVELDREAALRYLSKGTLTFKDIGPDTPAGYMRVTYKGLGLGFIKNIGNRINNLFPVEKRIRMKF